MTTLQLVEHYSYTVDAVTFALCVALMIIIRWALYLSVDRKFKYLKQSVFFITLSALANLFFYVVCLYWTNLEWLVIVLRNLHHASLMLCMYVFVLYMKHMLNIKGKLATFATHLTRVVFSICFSSDMLSFVTGFGFHKTKEGLWMDPVVNPYTIFYVYAMLLFGMIFTRYAGGMIKSVRYCLVATQAIVILIMIVGGIWNTTTYTTFTYLMPVIVVTILLHSRPFDESTGAMSVKSFISYVEKIIATKMSVDYMVLQLYYRLDYDITTEFSKLLSTFWHKYFKEASFFSLEKGIFILVVPRIKKNGNTEQKIKDLFFNEFPKHYEKYRFKYKMCALFQLDFVKYGTEVMDIVEYLFLSMEENSALVIDDKLRQDLAVMRDVKEQLVDMEKHLDLDDERVKVFCQPIKNTKSGKYDTAEALMRLDIPGHDLIPPALFIPLAENFGYIHTLSKIMLHKVCKELKHLEDEGYQFERTSVNFAISEMRDENFCFEVLQIIKETGISPEKIGIELTESQNDNDFNLLREKIAFLKENGMTIYLDDFGTGYSNLDRILKLGLDVIKYDRSILMVADEDHNASFMVQHFAEAFKQLNYSLLFEGVETKSQEELCLDYGADYLQGFKFSKPIPIADLRDFFSKG